MGVTIKEIAEMAGVHRSTVDKVLHNRPGVSDKVRARVQKIITECGYQTNPIGKALQMQDRELKIHVLLLKVDAIEYLKKGIEEGLKQYAPFHIQIEYFTSEYPDIDGLSKLLENSMNAKPDGIILSPINTTQIVEKIDACEQKGIPVITVNSDIKGSNRLCFIGQDGFKAGCIAGRLMGEFLQGKGKVAIFTSGGDEYQSFPFGTREGGFLETMKKNYPQIEICPEIHTQENPAIVRREMRRICEENTVQGIFITCGGVSAVGDVLQEYEQKDIKVISYEIYPEIQKHVKENVITATLDSGIEKQGKMAMEVLMQFLIYGEMPRRKHLYTETRIILKECL